MLSKIYNKLRKVWIRPILLWLRIKGFFYSPVIHICLTLEARLWGGKVKIEQNVMFENKVYFQGEGSLHIDNNAWFGSVLAGTRNQPILLQPREFNAEIFIGKRTAIMNGCEFISRSSICIGDDCLIGANVKIIDSDFHGISPNQRLMTGKTIPVVIENNVWIGDDVKILKGVTIGQDSVIGIGSVVTKSVAPGSIAAGIPAGIIGKVDEKTS